MVVLDRRYATVEKQNNTVESVRVCQIQWERSMSIESTRPQRSNHLDAEGKNGFMIVAQAVQANVDAPRSMIRHSTLASRHSGFTHLLHCFSSVCPLQ